MEINVKVSKLVATCLQRMIVEEVEKQKQWRLIDHCLENKNDVSTRTVIIEELQELSKDLEKQGIHKYIKTN